MHDSHKSTPRPESLESANTLLRLRANGSGFVQTLYYWRDVTALSLDSKSSHLEVGKAVEKEVWR